MSYQEPEPRAKRRSKEEIAYAILNAARSGERKTRMMYQVGLNLFQLDSYLETLIERGMITFATRRIYIVTEKGNDFIATFERRRELQNRLSVEEKSLDDFFSGSNSSLHPRTAMTANVKTAPIEPMARM